MLVMIGAGIALQSGILWIFGGVAQGDPSPFPESPWCSARYRFPGSGCSY